jgi:hypothetical protein
MPRNSNKTTTRKNQNIHVQPIASEQMRKDRRSRGMRNAQAFYFIAIQSAPRGDPLDTPRKGFLYSIHLCRSTTLDIVLLTLKTMTMVFHNPPFRASCLAYGSFGVHTSSRCHKAQKYLAWLLLPERPSHFCERENSLRFCTRDVDFLLGKQILKDRTRGFQFTVSLLP